MMKSKLLRFYICFISGLFVILIPSMAIAQGGAMADTFRSNGKIYVVVAVVVCILLGILFFILQTDRKLKKLEDKIKQKQEKE